MDNLISKWHNSVEEIDEQLWNNLHINNSIPFYTWKWLQNLEKSGSVNKRKGWQPLFLSIWRNDSLISVAPLYIKYHSYGEFIFDNLFNQLAIDIGINYYPKLVGMSPFSPIEGYKFIFAAGQKEEELSLFMFKQIDEFAIRNKINSCNFLYVDPIWGDTAKKLGCSEWINKKSLWTSRNEVQFCDYLQHFNSNQRRNIKRERKSISDKGIKIKVVEGEEIQEKDMKNMYDFYSYHCDHWGIWGSKYLSKEFFTRLSNEDHKRNSLLFIAHENGNSEPLAMSLCIKNETMIWGRYWGSKKNIDSLHFELCFYSPIEWAIKNQIQFFDPGAGGGHKQRRGFLFKPTRSMHRWYNNKMNSIINKWLPRANGLILEEMKIANNEIPIKKL